MRIHRILPLVAAFAAGTPFAVAQDTDTPSVEEITNKLNQQTRGLVIAPTDTPTTSGETQVVQEDYAPVDEAVRIDVPITFDFDSAVIRADQRGRLEAVCTAVKASTVERLQIIGHTDASGSAAYNANLSKLRADEVKRFLVGECGIEEFRLEAIGAGEDFPANSADPSADENRRVEFQALS